MLKVNQIQYYIKNEENPSYEDLTRYCESYLKKQYHINKIDEIEIVKKSLDARTNKPLAYILNVLFKTSENQEAILLKKYKKITKYEENKEVIYLRNLKGKINKKVLVVGMGPSGLFNAYVLAKAGFNVTLIDRGKAMTERVADVEEFFSKGILKSSNVQFGEGGAGTFSDGKLGTNVNSCYQQFIYETFVENGASPDILYEAHPHIGTDILRKVIINLRNKLIILGVKVLFETTLVNLEPPFAMLRNNEHIYDETFDKFVLAIGHSAQDTYEMLQKKELHMEPKPFSMGVRIEHLQKNINKSQYHGDYPFLPPADYKLFVHLPNGRCVYTFCMCPGGYVVNASSEEGYLVTNGMSNYLRNNDNANSALLVSVNVNDFYKGNPLDGVYFQKEYEKKAYEKYQNYIAPVTLLKDFMTDTPSKALGKITPTIKPGYKLGTISECLPEFVVDALKKGIPLLDKKLSGFADPDALMTAIESRSSSPVRLVRDENFMTSMKDVYAIGEGAGYAGGITTSAIDGIKAALQLIKENENVSK